MIDTQRYLTLLNFPIDSDRIMREALDESGYVPFADPLTQKEIAGWKIKRPGDTPSYAFELQEAYKHKFGLEKVSARFYIQQPGYTVQFHTDRGNLCSFNWVLQGQKDYLYFPDCKVQYSMALLNAQRYHAIINPKQKRILFKLSVFDQDYDTVLGKIKSAGLETRVAEYEPFDYRNWESEL